MITIGTGEVSTTAGHDMQGDAVAIPVMVWECAEFPPLYNFGGEIFGKCSAPSRILPARHISSYQCEVFLFFFALWPELIRIRSKFTIVHLPWDGAALRSFVKCPVKSLSNLHVLCSEYNYIVALLKAELPTPSHSSSSPTLS